MSSPASRLRGKELDAVAAGGQIDAGDAGSLVTGREDSPWLHGGALAPPACLGGVRPPLGRRKRRKGPRIHRLGNRTAKPLGQAVAQRREHGVRVGHDDLHRAASSVGLEPDARGQHPAGRELQGPRRARRALRGVLVVDVAAELRVERKTSPRDHGDGHAFGVGGWKERNDRALLLVEKPRREARRPSAFGPVLLRDALAELDDLSRGGPRRDDDDEHQRECGHLSLHGTSSKGASTKARVSGLHTKSFRPSITPARTLVTR